MIYITGDTHRDFERIFVFCEENDTTTDDILIILGDAGINYFLDSSDYALKCELSALEVKRTSGARRWIRMIYAMSDIHGFADIFQENLKRIDLSGENRLVLLGDYIDYGPESGRSLRLVFETQKRYGTEKVIVLRGNHEEMFLEWLDAYAGPHAGQPDADGLIPWSDWLLTDPDFGTFRSFLSEAQWAFFRHITRTASDDTLNIEAAKMILSANRELIRWLRGLPYYHETERQIFVHAGVDEEAEDWWKYGTPEYMFVGKYPASTGTFYKDIIAGHIGTARIAGDPDFHGVYHDGQSHYYIDGTVNESGRIPILAYDETKGKYLEIKEEPV